MAETNLDKLIAGMSPVLAPDVYVFTTSEFPPDIPFIMRFEEAEGKTLIVTRTAAKTAGLNYEFPSRMITLNVHSSLDAVGFMAVIATGLAAEGMGVNPVAGFHHDHIFVPEDRAKDAMGVLTTMAIDTHSS